MSIFVCSCEPRELSHDHTTLFLYHLLQGNTQFASFVYSRSDIDLMVGFLFGRISLDMFEHRLFRC